MSDPIRLFAISVTKTIVNSVIIAAVVLATFFIAYRTIRPATPSGTDLAISFVRHSLQSNADGVADMVKHFFGIADAGHVDSFVQSQVGDLHGEVVVKGWSARAIAPDMYVVAFEWSNPSGDGNIGMYWEVDAKSKWVRPVVPDDELAVKYGIRSRDEVAQEDATTLAAIKNVFPQASLTYAHHVLQVEGKPNGEYDPKRLAQQIHDNLGQAFEHRKDRYLKVRVTKGDQVGEYAGRL